MDDKPYFEHPPAYHFVETSQPSQIDLFDGHPRVQKLKVGVLLVMAVQSTLNFRFFHSSFMLHCCHDAGQYIMPLELRYVQWGDHERFLLLFVLFG